MKIKKSLIPLEDYPAFNFKELQTVLYAIELYITQDPHVSKEHKEMYHQLFKMAYETIYESAIHKMTWHYKGRWN